jgi:hypothetical protein
LRASAGTTADLSGCHALFSSRATISHAPAVVAHWPLTSAGTAVRRVLLSAMATSATKNLYHRRLVAESASKPCWICYKPASTVLITPEQDDFFYICPGHLADRKFAIAKDADDVAERKRKEELEKEIEAVKAEFAEKMRKKLDRRRQKEYEKEGEKEAEEEKKDEKKEDEEDEEDEKAKEAKLNELEARKDGTSEKVAKVEGPRIFELQKQFWQMRLRKKRDAEVAKRNMQRLKTPGAFPSVPAGDLA